MQMHADVHSYGITLQMLCNARQQLLQAAIARSLWAGSDTCERLRKVYILHALLITLRLEGCVCSML